MRTLWRIKIPPGRFCRITQGLGGYTRRVRSRAPSGESKYPQSILPKSPGGYTRRVRSRAPSGKSKYPLGDSVQITWGLGGYTRRVRSCAPRTLWQVKSPPGDSIRITRGLGGYCQGPNTRVPKEEELITIKR